jgi:ABC-type amino acid transport substrate-binding protein
MRHLTWRLVAAAIAASLATGTIAAKSETTLERVKEKGVLVAGSSAEYPPFEFVADGKLVGYDVEMAEEITRRMGVKIEWEKIDFKGIVAALTAKRVDVLITALTYTPERAARVLFSEPYFDAGIGPVGRVNLIFQLNRGQHHRSGGDVFAGDDLGGPLQFGIAVRSWTDRLGPRQASTRGRKIGPCRNRRAWQQPQEPI